MLLKHRFRLESVELEDSEALYTVELIEEFHGKKMYRLGDFIGAKTKKNPKYELWTVRSILLKRRWKQMRRKIRMYIFAVALNVKFRGKKCFPNRPLLYAKKAVQKQNFPNYQVQSIFKTLLSPASRVDQDNLNVLFWRRIECRISWWKSFSD